MAQIAAAQTNPARRWCFTWNNPGEQLEKWKELPEGVRFLIWQAERGRLGTVHLQGYAEFTRTVRMTGVKIILGSEEVHVEKSRGSSSENIAYCTKEDTKIAGPWRLGAPAREGGKTELQQRLVEAAELIKQKRTIAEVDSDLLIRYPAGFAKVAALVPAPMRPNLVVICIVGPTGTGKTWTVHDLFPPEQLYTVNYGNGGIWWDGYIGQQVVLFDEFRAQVPLQRMLKLLDVYPAQLEIKGGFTPALYRVVFLTSNTNPELWYGNLVGRDEYPALLRRLGVIISPTYSNIETARQEVYDAVRQRLEAYKDVLAPLGIVPSPGHATAVEPPPLLYAPSPPPRVPTEPIEGIDELYPPQPVFIDTSLW